MNNIAGDRYPKITSLIREAWGSLARVRVYQGDPECNSTGDALKDATLLWSKGMDWKATLESIKPDPTAGRQARKSDLVPFRPEQIGMAGNEMEALVDLVDQGVLTWRFIPMDEITPISSENMLDPKHDPYIRRMVNSAGKQLQALAPYVLGFVQEHLDGEVAGMGWRDDLQHLQRSMKFNGTLIHAMTGPPPIRQLDDIATHRLALVTYLDKRGPNGFWLVERGPNHPLVKTFEKSSMWVIEEAPGQPYMSMNINNHETATYLMAEKTEKGAQRYLKDLNEGWDSDFEPLTARQVSGKELLDILALADAIEGKVRCVALNWRGEIDLKHEGYDLKRSTPDELVAMFPLKAPKETKSLRPQ